MFYFTYVLKTQKDGRYYMGSTANLVERLKSHKNRRPLELIYYEACKNRKQAEKREKYFKTGFGRGFLKTRI